MGLVYILICLVLISHIFRISAVEHLVDFFLPFHSQCLKLTPPNVRSVESLQALVCGKSFSSADQSQKLIASGLIHLFVVSGSHLVILEKILQQLSELILNFKCMSWADPEISRQRMQFFILLFLFFYCAVCKFNPPVFRSFIVILLAWWISKLNLRWHFESLILVAGLTCLCLSPSWSHSLSLQMSWLAALALVLIARFYTRATQLFKNSIFYIQYLCTFNSIGIPSPFSIGVSSIMTPFLEYILFPLALLVYVMPPLGIFFDLIIEGLNHILTYLELSVIFKVYQSDQVVFLNWILICSLHLFLHFNLKPIDTPMHRTKPTHVQ